MHPGNATKTKESEIDPMLQLKRKYQRKRKRCATYPENNRTLGPFRIQNHLKCITEFNDGEKCVSHTAVVFLRHTNASALYSKNVKIVNRTKYECLFWCCRNLDRCIHYISSDLMYYLWMTILLLLEWAEVDRLIIIQISNIFHCPLDDVIKLMWRHLFPSPFCQWNLG